VSDHWQVVQVTGIGHGELWFDKVTEEVTHRRAEELARKEPDYIAVPTPYDPTEAETELIDKEGFVVDDYQRGVTEQ